MCTSMFTVIKPGTDSLVRQNNPVSAPHKLIERQHGRVRSIPIQSLNATSKTSVIPLSSTTDLVKDLEIDTDAFVRTDSMNETNSNANKSINHRKKIGIIDDFTVCRKTAGVPHGAMVVVLTRLLLKLFGLQPGSDVKMESFTNNERVKVLTDFIPEQLHKMIEEGDFNAINISAGVSKPIRILAKRTGIEDLNRNNLNEHKDQIRGYLLKTKDKDFSNIASSIKALEELTNKDVKVYLAAGNNGPDNVNLFSFANGVTSVGACDAKGNPLENSAQNDMINRYARGEYKITCKKDLEDKNKNKYYIDIDEKQAMLPHPYGKPLSDKGQPPVLKDEDFPKPFQGTSYAAPTALVTDLASGLI